MKRSFEHWGKKGGKKRARLLSPTERSAIAAKAAKARWNKVGAAATKKPSLSVRLDHPQLEDPVYVEELLSEGSLTDWRRLYQQIADQPFGPTTQALQKVLSATEIYGVSHLWKGILQTVQGGLP